MKTKKKDGFVKNEDGKGWHVKVSFTKEQKGWVSAAADAYTDGDVVDLVSNLFWDAFQAASEKIAAEVVDGDVRN